MRCPVCPHHCLIPEGSCGRCGARKNRNGKIQCVNYGTLTSIAMDPIEKKPLAFYYPGSFILSVGSFGCNMACPFCQNYEISDPGAASRIPSYHLSPEQLCALAEKESQRGNIGVAFTYNEPLIGYEYVRDCAKLLRENGMKTVLVTNGMAERSIFEELLPFIDAMNIDLKGFRPEIYQRLGGDLETVKTSITLAASRCHVELTSLIVPGFNDSLEDMQTEADWIAGIDPDLPLHLTRYFPRHKMHAPATDLSLLQQLKKIAQGRLSRVLLGNV